MVDVESIKEAGNKAVAAVDEALAAATKGASSALASLVGAAGGALGQGQEALNDSKGKLDEGLAYLSGLQDEAFAQLKGGVTYAVSHPEVSYPAAAAAALVLLPGVRRLLYRATLARLRNPEAVVSGAQTRLSAIGGRVDALSKEATKLSQRAAAADEEMTRGYQKLKAARAELQRLEGAVAKSERAAEAVLADLRVFRKAAGATELRADAAQKVAALRSQRAAVAKEIHWISKKDV